MRVLNLSSDYSRQGVYKNLAGSIAASNEIDQDIYVPIRTAQEDGVNPVDHQSVRVHYKHLLTKKDRFFYFGKIRKIFRDVCSTYDLDSCQMVHAHFLFSDGGVALKIKEAHGIPYIVAVRNTDVNFFFKFGIHLRKYGIKVLRSAEKIVFISPAYVDHLMQYVPSQFKQEILDKVVVIPNGVNQYWIDNAAAPKSQASEEFRFLYVGDFTPNKSVPYLIQFVQNHYPNAHLDIVGSKGDDTSKIQELSSGSERIHLHGRINDKASLKQLYRNADVLCILSRTETFGVAYIESLSQGTPILYTKGQGVDGCFESAVGEAVVYGDEKDLKRAIQQISTSFESYSKNAVASVKNFEWSSIARTYINIYKTHGRES